MIYNICRASVLSLFLIVNFAFAITNGERASLSQFPWQVSLQYEGRHRCGGVIISPKYILTAAHCIKDGIGPLEVLAGGDGTLINLKKLPRVESIITHPNWDNNRFDITLIKLESKVVMSRSIQPVQLPKANISINDLIFSLFSTFSFSGWGKTEDGITSDVLRSITNFKSLPLYRDPFWDNPANMNRYFPRFGRAFFNHDYIPFAEQNNIGACVGDSGGPLVVNRINKKPTLIGLASFITSDCGQNASTVFTNVHFFNDWIRSQIKSNI